MYIIIRFFHKNQFDVVRQSKCYSFTTGPSEGLLRYSPSFIRSSCNVQKFLPGVPFNEVESFLKSLLLFNPPSPASPFNSATLSPAIPCSRLQRLATIYYSQRGGRSISLIPTGIFYGMRLQMYFL